MSDLINRESAIVRACAVIKDDYVAYDVVQALKAMPSAQPQACDDAISREDAKWVVFCNRDHVEDQTNAIDSLPCVQSSAQPEQRWIPVSERLPERGKDVLVTRDYDGRTDHIKSCRYVEVASCYGEDDDVSWNSYSDEYKMTPKNHRVVAWMPLPAPWKGE